MIMLLRSLPSLSNGNNQLTKQCTIPQLSILFKLLHLHGHVLPPHIQHLTRHRTPRTKPDLGARMLFENRRRIHRIVSRMLDILRNLTARDRRHFRHAVLITVCRGLCHAELLFEPLLRDACGLLVYPGVNGAEAWDRGACGDEGVAADCTCVYSVARRIVGRLRGV
jgi:hypothetical protein